MNSFRAPTLRDRTRPRRQGWIGAARAERGLEGAQVAIIVVLALVVLVVAAVTGRGMVQELHDYRAQQLVQSQLNGFRTSLQQQESAFWRYRAEGRAGSPPGVSAEVMDIVGQARALRQAQLSDDTATATANRETLQRLGALLAVMVSGRARGPQGSPADVRFISRLTPAIRSVKASARDWSERNDAALEASNRRVVVAARRIAVVTGATAILAILLGLLTWRLVSRSRRRIVATLEAATEQLRHLADTDPLTGLSNHRLLQGRLQQAIRSGAVAGGGLSAIMIDLDHFKVVNDTFGHPLGDQVLVETAERLRASSRDGDVVARIGGEEFLMLLPDTDSETALAIAERVRNAVNSVPYAGVGRLTCSLGVSTIAYGVDADDLIEQADAALYWAKSHGRDVAFRYRPESMRGLPLCAAPLARPDAPGGLDTPPTAELAAG